MVVGAWQEVCMVEGAWQRHTWWVWVCGRWAGMHDRGVGGCVCMAGGMHGRGCMTEGVHGKGHALQAGCITG